jgi:diacylglycerol kinase family enzyme
VRSVPAGRRVSAVVALLAPLAVLAVLVAVLIRRPLVLLSASACLSLGVGAAAYAVTRTGTRRTLATVLAVLALVASIVLLIAAAGGLVGLLVVVALIVVGGLATRHALGRDIRSLKSSPTPGAAVGPAARPVLLLNPRSGGGKVERFDLVAEARRRGIEPVVLHEGDDLRALAAQAVADGADVVGMAGGDGSQALVAGVAAAHDVGFVCVPAGTRNHLAMDLGLDRSDVVGALDGFGAAVERRIDLGVVGERVFVNNATVGLYAKIVQSPAYRDNKVATALGLLPELLGPDAAPFDLQFTGPDGTEHASAHLILVANDRYELGSGEGFGSRRSIDTPAASASSRLGSGPDRTWRGSRSDRPTAAAAAAVPTKGWATVTALLQTAAGRPVTIEP